MKTDSLFYRLFQIRPQLLFDLLSTDLPTNTNYKFTSVEVKQLSFRLDGIFLPNSNDSTLPFYLVEVQFQPKDNLYYRLFAELFLYLRQYQPPQPWRVVVIYPRRSVEKIPSSDFQDLLNSPRVTRIYLDELKETKNSPLGLSLGKLIISEERETPEKARDLLQRTQEQLQASNLKRDIIDLIESIMVYKFPQKSRQEVAKMLGIEDLKQTRFYQEVFAEGKEEGKEEVLSNMIKLGMNLETIAQCLDLPLETVRQKANQKDDQTS